MVKGFNIKKEHEIIERELIELETVMEDEEFNYTNMQHVFRKLNSIWNSHEEREEMFLKNLLSENTSFPIEKRKIEHRELRGHCKVINDAINSGDVGEMEVSLETDGKMMIDKFRKHMVDEEDLLRGVVFRD
jgi:hypothetical protein